MLAMTEATKGEAELNLVSWGSWNNKAGESVWSLKTGVCYRESWCWMMSMLPSVKLRTQLELRQDNGSSAACCCCHSVSNSHKTQLSHCMGGCFCRSLLLLNAPRIKTRHSKSLNLIWSLQYATRLTQIHDVSNSLCICNEENRCIPQPHAHCCTVVTDIS